MEGLAADPVVEARLPLLAAGGLVVPRKVQAADPVVEARLPLLAVAPEAEHAADPVVALLLAVARPQAADNLQHRPGPHLIMPLVAAPPRVLPAVEPEAEVRAVAALLRRAVAERAQTRREPLRHRV